MLTDKINDIVEDLIVSELVGSGGYGIRYENRVVSMDDTSDFTLTESKGDQFYIRPLRVIEVDFDNCEVLQMDRRYRLLIYLEDDCHRKNKMALLIRVLAILKRHRGFKFTVDDDKFSVWAKEFGTTQLLELVAIDFTIVEKYKTDCPVC